MEQVLGNRFLGIFRIKGYMNEGLKDQLFFDGKFDDDNGNSRFVFLFVLLIVVL